MTPRPPNWRLKLPGGSCCGPAKLGLDGLGWCLPCSLGPARCSRRPSSLGNRGSSVEREAECVSSRGHIHSGGRTSPGDTLGCHMMVLRAFPGREIPVTTGALQRGLNPETAARRRWAGLTFLSINLIAQ